MIPAGSRVVIAPGVFDQRDEDGVIVLLTPALTPAPAPRPGQPPAVTARSSAGARRPDGRSRWVTTEA